MKVKLQMNEHEIPFYVNNNSRLQIVQLEFTTWKYKGLVTHNDILKICRITQYSKNIFKYAVVKNIFKILKRLHFYSKSNFCIIKSNQFDFIHYTEIIFLNKTQ